MIVDLDSGDLIYLDSAKDPDDRAHRVQMMTYVVRCKIFIPYGLFYSWRDVQCHLFSHWEVDVGFLLGDNVDGQEVL